MLRALRAVAAVAVLAGACTRTPPDDPITTVPTAPGETTAAPVTATTTPPADPFAAPAVVDEAYVNRVLAALDKVDGDALRSVVATRTVDRSAIERTRAIYNDPEFDVELASLHRVLTPDRLAAFRSPPGDRRTEVRRISSSRPGCLVVEVTLDFSAVALSPPAFSPNERQVIVLVPTQAGANPKGLNPTPWSIRYDNVITVGETDKEAMCPG
ncbi:MAG: hypothetical protein ACR2MO_08225 [Acidimicrobiales bacterium]